MRTQIPASIVLIAAAACILCSCGNGEKASANSGNTPAADVSVGVAKAGRETLDRTLTLSSELVPFQETDVYAKESGYVKTLSVDYGSRVKAGQVMAILEIPELQLQVVQDEAAIRNAQDQIVRAHNELDRWEATVRPLRAQYERLNGVAQSKKGLVAQQEVDDAEGKYQAAAAQVESAKASLQSAESQLQQAQAKRERDQVMFNYSKITAPFDGVVTQRYANQGTLMQAGTSSSTNVIPLVKISQEDLFRLVIPVPESAVHFIHVNDPVKVSVPSLNRNFSGKVVRFSVDVAASTRTMHTEVNVPNQDGTLYPGLYADATLTLERKANALVVPVQAIDRNGDNTTVDVVMPDNKIEIRRVVLGIQSATSAEVLSGLNEGDTVVVSDRSSLKGGQAVVPKAIDLLQYHSQEEQH